MIVISFLGTEVTNVHAQQVKVTEGPALENDRDSKMNRMINGDENNFYCYRVRSKGKGTSFIVEKYDKKSLKPVFSKEIDLGEDRTVVEDVEFAMDNIYVFSRHYDKNADKMTLSSQTVSASGQVNNKKTELVTVKSDHYEFVDFDVTLNPAKTKFMIKTSHKPNKEGKFKTDFDLVSTSGMKKEWTKTVNVKLFSKSDNMFASGMMAAFGLGGFSFRNEIGFLGLLLDDNDNVYYGYLEEAKNSTEKAERYQFKLGVFTPAMNEPKLVDLKFDDDYWVKDIEFSKTKNDELVIGGFLKDVIERKGRDLVKVGIFSFTVNLTTYAVVSHPVKMFDEKMLTALESNPKRSRYFKYKLDYILPAGDAVFYVGEQYREQYVNTRSSMGGSSGYWEYEYMDVIVAKLNAKGEFEWISNAPLRNEVKMPYSHVFKQYFAVATEKNIYLFNNDHPKNLERYEKSTFEPRDLKSVSGIHGSSFVFSSVSTANGAVKHKLIMENETYCFAPIQERNPQFIPPSESEIFVPGANNELYVYTEDRGKDRFTKLTITE